MTNETVTKSGRFYCVSLTPDICKTPVGASTPPLPYTIVGEFSEAKGASPNVKSHSEPVVLHGRTTIPTVKGRRAGQRRRRQERHGGQAGGYERIESDPSGQRR